MARPDVERAQRYALERLERDLPATLAYHGVQHTRDGVVPAAEQLGRALGLDEDELLLVRTAAWFHDLGFVAQRQDHEATSVRIAAGVLPRFGYSPSQIDAIAGMIMATRLPQAPRSLLEQVLADADLTTLGRDDFMAHNMALRAELAAFGEHVADADWYASQLRFLEQHRYWTAPARSALDACKQRNVELLRARLRQSLPALGLETT